MFFTPLVKFQLFYINRAGSKWFIPGKIYHDSIILSLNLSNACPKKNLKEKLQYLSTRWIMPLKEEELEKKDIHTIVKLIVLNKESDV